MNNDLRNALRFAAYIRCIGHEPIPIQRRSSHEWALDLQRQHERLRQGLSPEAARAAKASARALIREKGYRRAAEEAAPVQVTDVVPEQGCGNHVGVDEGPAAQTGPTAAVLSAKEHRALKRDRYLCRRKLRHPDYWSAVQHALRLGGDVQVFECPQCDGLHVGHNPEGQGTKQYRRARKRLRAIQNRLGALEREQTMLISERSQLMRELGKLDALAMIHPGFLKGVRSLLRMFRLRNDRAVASGHLITH